MSIRTTLARSKDDLEPIQNRSFASQIITTKDIEISSIDRNSPSDAEKRMIKIEHTEQGAQNTLLITGYPDGLSVNQIRDLFDEIGFNSDVTMSEVHGSDISIVVNIGGYLLPFWKEITSLFSNKWRKILLFKLAPGKKRLHGRLFHHSDNSWYLVTHVDEANWFNILTPKKLFRSHLQKGTGNYILGHKIASAGIRQFLGDMETEVDFGQIYKEYLKDFPSNE